MLSDASPLRGPAGGGGAAAVRRSGDIEHDRSERSRVIRHRAVRRPAAFKPHRPAADHFKRCEFDLPPY
jgi:hypothetical protein